MAVARRTVADEAAAARAAGWRVARCRGPASTLVAPEPTGGAPREPQRAVTICEVTTPAFVLGSTQPGTDVDAERAGAAGVEVCRRRAGGGGVLVLPAAQLWLDVFVPTGDPLWEQDVVRSFGWLGVALAGAIGSVTRLTAVPHEGGLRASEWSSRLCFAGIGPGEVSVEGRKVAGISQRRDRRGSLLRAMVLLRHDPEQSASLLALPARRRQEAAEFLGRTAAAVGTSGDGLEDAVLASIAACG